MHASIVPVILAMAIRPFNCNSVGGQRQMQESNRTAKSPNGIQKQERQLY